MAKARRRRKRYTPAQRSEILAAANKDGLTALQVQKKFGVTPVTYYSWRKKVGAVRRRGRLVARATVGGSADLGSQVRYEVANRVRQIIPRHRAQRGQQLPQLSVRREPSRPPSRRPHLARSDPGVASPAAPGTSRAPLSHR